MKIAIATDAWAPQVNGVVRTLQTTSAKLREFGHEVMVLEPGLFRTVPCPTYPSIRLAVFPGRGVKRRLAEFDPDAVHVATEGPIGLAARRWCLRTGRDFTTSFHTQFPEYVRARAPVPLDLTYALVKRFHAPAVRTMVPTPSQVARLEERGFEHLRVWSRGVDTEVFQPRGKGRITADRPVLMYMGRVAVEKNIEAFLELDVPGEKVVVGDGPDLEKLRLRYTDAHFVGARFGVELAETLSAADVFVFPSLTDTFGLVIIEAMACGLPVAAFPVTGPIDIVRQGVTGCLDEDLGAAVRGALALDGARCVEAAREYSWENCSRQFESYLAFRTAPETAGLQPARAD